MKGQDIINNASEVVTKIPSKGRDELALATHARLLEIHARALAAHCECLSMNAENMWAAITNGRSVYLQKDYLTMMTKWGLINEKYEPTI